MRILLVTDEDGYANDVIAASAAMGAAVTVAPYDWDLHGTALDVGANVVVFDAGNRFGSNVRAAKAFADVHPSVVVAVVATGVDDGESDNVVLMHRWHCAERLLEQLRSRA